MLAGVGCRFQRVRACARGANDRTRGANNRTRGANDRTRGYRTDGNAGTQVHGCSTNGRRNQVRFLACYERHERRCHHGHHGAL